MLLSEEIVFTKPIIVKSVICEHTKFCLGSLLFISHDKTDSGRRQLPCGLLTNVSTSGLTLSSINYFKINSFSGGGGKRWVEIFSRV